MLTDLWFRLRALVRGAAMERELDEEIQAHVERETEKHIASGLSRPQAQRLARQAFGGVEGVKEQCRSAHGTRLAVDLLQDARYAVRILRRSPGFTISAVMSLALGIGANTAIFTLMDATLLRPLPVFEPDRLIELMTVRGSGPPGNAFSYQALAQFRDQATTLDAVIASHASRLFIAVDGAAPEIADGQYVTGNFFPALGVSAALGRAVQPADDRADAAAVAVLSHSYWQRRFAGDPSVVGRRITVNDHAFSIAGVAPREFRGTAVGRKVDLWIPLATERLLRKPSWSSSAGYKWLQVVGRLKRHTTFEQARAELETLFTTAVLDAEVAVIRQRTPDYQRPAWRLAVAPAASGLSMLRQQYRDPLLVLFVVSGLVLIIACVNVANLLLARASARRGEVVMRLSLGAPRGRIVRQLLTENMLLGLAGAIVGVVFAYAGSSYLIRLLTFSRTPVLLDVTPDWRVLTFVATLAVGSGLLFGLVPAWRTAGRSSRVTLVTDVRVHGSRDRRRLSRVLIAGQVALSVVMLFCGGLFLRSLTNLRSIETGFDSHSVLLVSTDASRSRLTAEQHRTLFREAVERLAAIPGVRSASMADVTPLWGGGTTRDLEVRHTDGGVHQARGLYLAWVSPGYFATLGIPLAAGRDFTWSDTASSPRVALINQTMARRHFANSDPLGSIVGKGGERYEIIGVVGDAKYLDLREEIPATLYLHSFQQQSATAIAGQFLLRTANDPSRLVSVARDEIRRIVPSAPVTEIRTLDEQIDASIARERLLAILSGVFATLGQLLAVVGLYGVTAYTVAARTREIGIRIAIGARTSDVVGTMVREALLLIATGVLIGAPAAVLLSQTLQSLLFGLTPHDPLTVTAVIVIMTLTGVAAAYLPARRAARIEPTIALRLE